MHTWSIYTKTELEFNTLIHSQVMQSSHESTSDHEKSANSISSTEPRNFRLLSNVYNITEEIEFSDELLLLGIEELSNFNQAVKDIG